MGQKELTATLARIKELEAEHEAITDELEALKDTVKAYMVSQGTETMRVGVYKVSYKRYTSSRFDSKAFKVEHEALYNQYIKTTEARRFMRFMVN